MRRLGGWTHKQDRKGRERPKVCRRFNRYRGIYCHWEMRLGQHRIVRSVMLSGSHGTGEKERLPLT